MPPASHIVCRPYRPPVCSRWLSSVVMQPGAGRAERMAERDRAAARVEPGPGRSRNSRSQASGTGANASLTSTASMSSTARPARSSTLCGRRDRAGEHQHRVVAAHRRGDDAGPRPQPERRRAFLAHQQHRGRAVGELRGVAGGDLPLERRGSGRASRRCRTPAAARPASPRVVPGRIVSSASTTLPSGAVIGDDLVVEARRRRGAARPGRASAAEYSSSCCAGQLPLRRRPARRRRPAGRGRGSARARPGRTGRRPGAPSPSAPGSSTRCPPAITMS